jgi:tRNA A37 threonylcarbamoyladenosine dehydratase
MYKVDAAAQRIHEINPDCKVTCHRMFYMPDTADKLDFSQFDYAVDAIDTVTGKIEIIMQAKSAGVPVISSMGAGNKLDPAAFEVSDIYKTSVCPLAKVMRYQLKRRGVKKLKVVYSKEEPITPQGQAVDDGSGKTDMRSGSARRSTPASVAFVASVVGLIIAGEVIKDIVKKAAKENDT